MLEYLFFTILLSSLFSLTAVLFNGMVASAAGERDFLQSWKGWQISFLLRVSGLALFFLLLGVYFQSGYISFSLAQELTLSAFVIFLLGFFFDFGFSLRRLQKREFVHAGRKKMGGRLN